MREYSLADYAEDAQRNAASCIIPQRKTGCLRLRLFWGLSAIICVISERLIEVSFVLIDRVLLRVILPQIAQITQRNAASCIISQRKTICLRLMLFCGFVVRLRKSARFAGDTVGSSVWID